MWRLVGTATPTTEWRIFGSITLGRTYRVTYQGLQNHGFSYGLIRNYYYNDTVGRQLRLYPKKEKEVIELAPPQQLEEQDPGLIVRYLGIKKVVTRRYGVTYPDGNWSILVEEWV